MYAIQQCRCFGIAAHVDAGKTTLSERILFHTGQIRKVKEVHHGGATTDATAIERRHGISIHAAAVNCVWDEHRLTLVDTPGHIDFSVEVERSLRVLDGAVLVLCAVGGVQAQTGTVHRQMSKYELPFVAFINKCDRPGANPDAVIAELRNKLGIDAIALQIPIGLEGELEGVIDLVSLRELRFAGEHGTEVQACAIDSTRLATAVAAREALLDAVSLYSDVLTEAIVAERPITEAMLHAAIREGVANGLVPVVLGTALRNVGVQPVLDAVVRYLPSPSGEQAASPVGFAFKAQITDHGPRTWIRVYDGIVRTNDRLLTARGEKVRIGRLVALQAGRTRAIDQLGPGEIGALIGTLLTTGDTLSPDGSVQLEGIEIAPPVVEVALSLRAGSLAHLSSGLHRLVAEDPTLRHSTDPESGELRLSGMGELHLQIAAERLLTEHAVEVHLGAPQVALRRSLRRVVHFDHLHRKQSGGPGQYAKIVGYLEPLDGLDNEVVWEVGGDVIPREFRSAVEKAVAHGLAEGLEDDVPWVGIRTVFTDGQTHSNDSSDRAFYMATRGALRVAMSEAEPMVLEPRMTVEVDAAAEHHGSVLRSLGRRKAEVLSSEVIGRDSRVVAEVPLSEMFGYAGDLRGVTAGNGSFSMTFANYKARS